MGITDVYSIADKVIEWKHAAVGPTTPTQSCQCYTGKTEEGVEIVISWRRIGDNHEYSVRTSEGTAETLRGPKGRGWLGMLFESIRDKHEKDFLESRVNSKKE